MCWFANVALLFYGFSNFMLLDAYRLGCVSQGLSKQEPRMCACVLGCMRVKLFKVRIKMLRVPL